MKKVALLFICLNPKYWQFIFDAVEGSKKFFLKGHQVDRFLWTDLVSTFPDVTYGCNVIETEGVGWPLPTLMRYHLFLQQEEKLKDYDYIFYCDIDMLFVGEVGDEILGDGLTAARHPMYALRDGLCEPYETNPDSTAYIPQSGTYSIKNGQNKFTPLYAAGGFQGGRSEDFIKAMKVMKRAIDEDFNNNYTARWNEESHWNRYLFDNPPAVVLDPGYVYPDLNIADYYIPIWGRDYHKKIITITKKFTMSKEGGEAAKKIISEVKHL